MPELQTIPVQTIDGRSSSLSEYAGSVLLVVNVASQCGLTPQYAGLEALYQRFRDDGLVVLGFPANDFAGQEPGTNDEIARFCESSFSVTFPLFAKISVIGDDAHPLYTELGTQWPRAEGDKDGFRASLREHGMTPTEDPDVVWNFEKFVVSRDGDVVARFAPSITPDDPALVAVIEQQLAR